jgi:hypothetical protein
LLCIQASFAVYTGLFCCVYRPLLLCIQASFADRDGPLLLLSYVRALSA